MNTLTSGKPFTIDPDYEAFSGRVVHTCSTTAYDPKAKAWIKRTVEYIDVGRPHKVEPVDCDEAMTPDPWEPEPNRWERARIINQQRFETREAIMQSHAVDYLKQFGPSVASKIAAQARCDSTTLYSHLTRREGTLYVRLGKNRKNATIWGLVGIHDREAA